jgi:hypothetical protein
MSASHGGLGEVIAHRNHVAAGAAQSGPTTRSRGLVGNHPLAWAGASGPARDLYSEESGLART